MAMHSHPVTDDWPCCRHALIRRSFCVYSSPGGGWPQFARSEIIIQASYKSKLGKPQYDWNFSTVPQMNGKSMNWAQGKGLGGSSSVFFFFLFRRPSTTDISAFEKLGNKGWN